MAPAWIAAVFLALVVFYTGQDITRKEEVSHAIGANASATNFLAYRASVRAFLAANPTATGAIDDASLEPFAIHGYIRNPNWANLIQGGKLYVYSTAKPHAGTAQQLFRMSGRSALCGTKNASTGRLVAGSGLDTGINLPAVIPDGAVVMIGS